MQSSKPTERLTEYRVCWRRDGGKRTTRIYQTRAAAHRKARGIVALEEVKDDTRMRDMPPLVESPVIEERPVGEWAGAETQPSPPTDRERQSMRDYFARDDEGWGGF